MKVLGIVLIVAGILMFIFPGFNYTKKEKVIDAGPIEVNKTEHKRVSWPIYAGAVAVVAGIVLILADRRRA